MDGYDLGMILCLIISLGISLPALLVPVTVENSKFVSKSLPALKVPVEASRITK